MTVFRGPDPRGTMDDNGAPDQCEIYARKSTELTSVGKWGNLSQRTQYAIIYTSTSRFICLMPIFLYL